MIKPTILIILSLFCTSIDAARKTYGDLEVTRLVKVIDGDTIKVDIDYIHPLLGDARNVRVYGVNTPEIRTRDYDEKVKGRKAKSFVIQELEGSKILLKDVSADKYFRILAEVFYKKNKGVSGEFGKYKNLTKELIKNGYGVEYYGGRK